MNREKREKWAEEFSKLNEKSTEKKLDKIIEFIEKQYSLDIEV